MAIPKPVLEQILTDSWYSQCCLCGHRPVQFHHNLIYQGRQVNEPWAILPCCPPCHAIEKRKDIKERLDWIMYNRATLNDLVRYSKVVDLISRRNFLNEKFGTFPAKDGIC